MEQFLQVMELFLKLRPSQQIASIPYISFSHFLLWRTDVDTHVPVPLLQLFFFPFSPKTLLSCFQMSNVILQLIDFQLGDMTTRRWFFVNEDIKSAE